MVNPQGQTVRGKATCYECQTPLSGKPYLSIGGGTVKGSTRICVDCADKAMVHAMQGYAQTHHGRTTNRDLVRLLVMHLRSTKAAAPRRVTVEQVRAALTLGGLDRESLLSLLAETE